MAKLMKTLSLLFSFLIVINAIASSQEPTIFSKMKEKEWVSKCVEQHPEILWLADADLRKTEEGQACSKTSYSGQLFDRKYIEFDRTLMTLHCLKLILNGSHEAYLVFTEAQPTEIKLSYDSFQELSLQGEKLLESNWEGMSKTQMTEAMEAALILGDIGKSEKARLFFKPYGIQAPDHDDFYGEAMQILGKHPELCPSFAKLPEPAKKLLVSVANLAHYGHLTHLEGGLEMFRNLTAKNLPSRDPVALSFDLFVHTCDLAGALGHVNHQSSLVYTQPTHRAMYAMGSAVKLLSDPIKNEQDAYNAYLGVRARWLGLNPEDPSDRVLTRIGAMLRLFTPEEGQVLQTAILGLPLELRNEIALQLDVQAETQLGRTPTYVPALLVNLSNHPQLGTTKNERLSQVITLGLPLIAKVLKKHKELLTRGEIDPNIPLNFNEMARIAKNSPYSLIGEFQIDQEGNVLMPGPLITSTFKKSYECDSLLSLKAQPLKVGRELIVD